MSRLPPPLAAMDDGLGQVAFTAHGHKRAAQRNVSEPALRYVLAYGSWSRKTGVDFVVLRDTDVPEEHRGISAIARLVGTVVLRSSDGFVTTVYRNRRAPRTIRKKRKERRRSGDSDERR